MTPFSGVRSSWLTTARKRDLVSLACYGRAARALGRIVLGKGLVAGLFELGGALDHLALERRVGFAQMRRHPVELIAERFQLVAGVDREPLVEIAAADPRAPCVRIWIGTVMRRLSRKATTRRQQASRMTRSSVERPIDA